VDAWYPIDTANFNFDYSIYLRDTVNGLFFDFPCDSVNNLFDSTAFLKENLKSGFLVYPNPFENSFTLQSKNQPISEIYVYDISGRCIFQRNELNTIATSIDANEFANGFYLVEVIFTDNTRLTKKIIKR